MKTSTYIPFTDEQKQRAATVDLESFLQSRGEKLISSGKDKRLASDHSITVQGSRWYDHSAQRGGNAISFVQSYYGQSFPETMRTLLGDDLSFQPPAPKAPVQPKPFALPPGNADMKRVYAYLIRQRHIDRDVISHFAKDGLIYEDAQYHNAVFVGKDENGKPVHAHKRSTNSYTKAFRQNVEGSDPQYSFHHIGTDGSLYVFEAPIDMLSYITMCPQNWQESSYVACCGTSIQPVMKMLERMHRPDIVFFCLDNDTTGQAASTRMAQELTAKGLHTDRITPGLKDWNEDLVQMRLNGSEEHSICQTLCP